MARFIYTLFLVLLSPLVCCYLLWRSRRQPAYRAHWAERFGLCFPARPSKPVIWLHAVSVGETRAAAPVIQALQAAHPGHAILLTQMTPTGRDTARTLFGDNVTICYLPYDFPWAVHRFLQHFRPELGLLMETELWPNLLHTCANRVPLYLINARLSEKSLRGYQRFTALMSPALQTLRGIAAQSSADAVRLRQLAGHPGLPAIQVCGNTKYDVTPPPAQLEKGRHWRELLGERPVVIAASTREGEEALLLQAWQTRVSAQDALLVLVPRHPQRFSEVEALLKTAGLTYQRRSNWDETPLPQQTEVLLGDSLGELFAYYAAGDVAFVGGSLLPLGGQNLIEPCSVGLPVVMGPSVFNFADASQMALEAGALRQGDTPEAVVDLLCQHLKHAQQRNEAGLAARQFAAAHRGATARIVAMASR